MQMNAPPTFHLPEALRHMFESPRFAAALTHVAFGTAFGVHLIFSVIGRAGLISILLSIAVLGACSLIARRESIEWHGLLPISIITFLGWSTVSLAWSGYTRATVLGLVYQLGFAFLALYVGLVRDTIQITRAVGDVLRVLLGLSIALEVLSGLLIDLPITFLGIQGNIAGLGPIQGVFGSRNTFALVALIALVTFAVELRSRSVVRGVGSGSLWLAGACLVLTRSPVITIAAVFVALAGAALFVLRRTAAEGRWMLQLGLLGLTLIALISGWIGRDAVLGYMNAGNEFAVRYGLWQEMWRLLPLHPLTGWGWTGAWPTQVTPYGWLDFVTHREHTSGLNAFLDVLFQLGLVGFLAFVALVALAFVRSWLLASNKRPVVFVWPALVLVILLVVSMAESTSLVGFGWMLLLVCSVKAAQGMSWRSALAQVR